MEGSQKSEVRNQRKQTDGINVIKSIQEKLGVPGLFAKILLARGIASVDEAEAFLYPRLDDLSDPFLLPDMEKGIDRIIAAIAGSEKICLYGDYDADGITSTALMINFLRHIGLAPDVYIPKRDEGYGLNIKAIERLKSRNVRLLVCLDCGSSNVEEIRVAVQSGMDVVVIDHHELPETIPDASAIINPKRKDSRFPTRELAACGVTFFFLWALRRVMHERGLLKGKINLKRELDLVALGTVGDMVPLTKDNRVMVKFGLENMRRQPRMWLNTFLKKNLLSRGNTVDEHALNFIIIPRINATGRVAEPEISLRFLVSNDEKSSEHALAEMNEANSRRQRICEEILNEITKIIERDGLAHKNSIVMYKKDWHIGVIGIVAQRLVEAYGKPAIVITRLNGICKGSGRGGDGLNLHETLSSLSHLLLKFGGHKYACGVSLSEENFGPFRDAFEKSVKDLPQDKKKTIHIDAQAEFEELTSELIGFIEQLSPYGVGNPRPGLLLTPSDISVVNSGRVRITDTNKKIWYGYIQGQQGIPRERVLQVVASPVIKEEMGEKFIYLNIKEMMTV